jgi:hypothetical protein
MRLVVAQCDQRHEDLVQTLRNDLLADIDVTDIVIEQVVRDRRHNLFGRAVTPGLRDALQ